MSTVQEKVIKIITEKINTSLPVYTDSLLKEDLGADSLDIIDIIIELEDFFNIEIFDDELYYVRNVNDIVRLICEKTKKSPR